MEVRSNIPIPKVLGRGNKKGCGRNIILLRSMEIGQSLWNVPKKKCNSIRDSARRSGFCIKVRKNPDNHMFIIWRVR